MRSTNWMMRNRITLLLTVLGLLVVNTPLVGLASVQDALQLYQQKQYAQAANAFEQAGSQANVSSDRKANILYYQADALYRSGQTSKAGRVYRQVIQTAPRTQAARYATVALERINRTVITSKPDSPSRKGAEATAPKPVEKQTVKPIAQQITQPSPGQDKKQPHSLAAAKPVVTVAKPDPHPDKPVNKQGDKQKVAAKKPAEAASKPATVVSAKPKTASQPVKLAESKPKASPVNSTAVKQDLAESRSTGRSLPKANLIAKASVKAPIHTTHSNTGRSSGKASATAMLAVGAAEHETHKAPDKSHPLTPIEDLPAKSSKPAEKKVEPSHGAAKKSTAHPVKPLAQTSALNPSKPDTASGKTLTNASLTNVSKSKPVSAPADPSKDNKAKASVKPAIPSAVKPAPQKDWTLISRKQEQPGKLSVPTKVSASAVQTLTGSGSSVKAGDKASASAQSADETDALTYLNRVDYAGMRVRWATQPITYYIERAPKGMKSFSPGFIAQTEKAFKTWQRASGHTVQLAAADTPETARIIVRWSNQVDTKGQATEEGTRYTAGYTIPLIAANQLRRMDVRLSTLQLNGAPVADMYPTAVHEVGHALGLLGHSDQPGDVMYPTHSKQAALSKRDVSTLMALYQQPAQITELPFKKLDTTSQVAVDARRQKDLKQMELLAQKDPSITVLNQLADLYRHEADATKDATLKRQWWQKALTVLNTSEKKYPSDGLTQLNKAVIASQLKDWPTADAAILKAGKRLPDNGEVFITMAEIKRAQKQYAEARNALTTYERLASQGELTQPRYKNLKQSLAAAPQATATSTTSGSIQSPRLKNPSTLNKAPTASVSPERPVVFKPGAPYREEDEPIAFPALSTVRETADADLEHLPMPVSNPIVTPEVLPTAPPGLSTLPRLTVPAKR